MKQVANSLQWIGIFITFVVVMLIFISVSCSLVAPNLKYIKQLPTDLRDWYGNHRYLMEARVPEWIDARKLSEGKHFLRLPSEELQRKYKAMFWKIRRQGLREVFYSRLAGARKYFREGSNRLSDRGFVFLKFGYPMSSYTYKDMTGRSYSNITDFDGSSLIVWEYLFQSMIVRYLFEFRLPNRWRTTFFSTMDLGNQSAHHQWFVKIWSPTEEGWDMWASELLHWVQENRGNKQVKEFAERTGLELRRK